MAIRTATPMGVPLAAVLQAVHKHAGLLRAGIATAGNEHRLGANEAPPAIISVFMGQTLSRMIEDIVAGKAKGEHAAQALIQLGVAKLPEIEKDNTKHCWSEQPLGHSILSR